MAVLLAVGLQHRSVDSVGLELDLPVNQVLAFFNKTVRRLSASLRSMLEADVAAALPSSTTVGRMADRADGMTSLAVSVRADQNDDERSFQKSAKEKDKKDKKDKSLNQTELLMNHKDLAMHAVVADSSLLECALDTAVRVQKKLPTSHISVPVATKSAKYDADGSVGAKKNGEKFEETTTNSLFSGKKGKKRKNEHVTEDLTGNEEHDAEESSEFNFKSKEKKLKKDKKQKKKATYDEE